MARFLFLSMQIELLSVQRGFLVKNTILFHLSQIGVKRRLNAKNTLEFSGPDPEVSTPPVGTAVRQTRYESYYRAQKK